jgi:hypothetical protein
VSDQEREEKMPLEFFVMMSMIGIVVFWVLLPLIPAVLIYRLFPDTSVAISGPLAGLTVRATGAFAGYLIVLAIIHSWTTYAYDFVGGSLHPAWTIQGRLNIVSKDGTPIRELPGDFFQKICLRTDPNIYTFEYPTFTITVPETPNGIPKIYLETAYGRSVPLELDDIDAASMNKFKKSMRIVKVLEIKQPSLNDSVADNPIRAQFK